MRALVVSQYFWPEEFPINDVVRSLVEQGVEVDVLTGMPNYPDGAIFSGYRAWCPKVEEKAGATLFRVPLIPRGRRSTWRLALNYLSFVVSGVTFGPWLLRNRRYDVVFAYAPSPILLAIPGIFLAWRRRLKFALWVQDLWPESLSATGYVSNASVLRVVEQVVRWIFRHTDLILVQSHAFAPSVAERVPGKRIVYHPNSVVAGFAKPENASVALPDVPALDTGFSVVFAGNVGAAQAVEVILQAAILLSDNDTVRFVVLGHGSRWTWMHEQVQALGLKNLHMPGRFPFAAMPGLLQKAGALLVTLADEPIFSLTVPSKVQAYMAAGRPIVACLNGEGARIVEEAKAGIVVPAEDARALAAAVLKLRHMDSDSREQLGANGRRYCTEHFDHATLVRQLRGYLQALSDEAEGWA